MSAPVICLFTAWFVILAVTLWAVTCNSKTLRQQNELIDAWHDDATQRAYSRVTYDQHFYALLMFRDPDKLYAPCLIAARDQTP